MLVDLDGAGPSLALSAVAVAGGGGCLDTIGLCKRAPLLSQLFLLLLLLRELLSCQAPVPDLLIAAVCNNCTTSYCC